MKKFKDPIYGYIKIEEGIVKDIVDTPEFQRLRYIRQTSYLPVYPAALHNRFVHSLGVYFLGCRALEAINLSIKKYNIDIDESIKNRMGHVFTLACLLHDVGHAPFSHSGEYFYLSEDNDLDTTLIRVVKDEIFEKEVTDYHKTKRSAAPHEIMSAIVGLERFSEYFENNEEKSLFARCITGYKYSNKSNDSNLSYYNILISLLNSSTIDVDRLDYLIRDAFVMGYNSISIDYKRLIDSVMISEDSEGHLNLAYNKSALSIIENVIYAHDSEKKWIQNHPVIIYEIFLVQQIIKNVADFYKQKTEKELFSFESLLPSESDNSISLNNVIFPSVSLLCDDDIIYLAKNLNNPFCQELFNRNRRRHPIWKSESEYKVIVDDYVGKEGYNQLSTQMDILDKFLKNESPSHLIDEVSMKFCQNELDECKNSDLNERDKKDMLHRYSLLLSWLECFEKISKQQNIPFDFVLVQATNFSSSFAKNDLREIQVYFPSHNCAYKLDELIELFSFKKITREKFFYVYYRNVKEVSLDIKSIGKEIAKNVLNL